MLNKFPEIRELYRENEGLNLSAPDRQFFVIENNKPIVLLLFENG